MEMEEINARRGVSMEILQKKKCGKQFLVCIIIAVLIAVIVFLGYFVFLRQKTTIPSLLGLENNKNKLDVSVGMRNDFLLQECKASGLKRSFPDVDYAFLGYDLLKGYPLSVGHDPGFTLPIFTADYSHGGQTADCRYSVPKGALVIPDVSCITSFSSKVAKSEYEFSEELSVSAKVSGGGWGVSFSASAGYKEAKSEMATGEYVFIISRANCNYYYFRLLEDDAPTFHPVFKKWIVKLARANPKTESGKSTYLKFFERFGTHYVKEIKFGASYTYEHRMSFKKYKTQSESNINVAVEASYSGLFSVGGGVNFDSSRRQRAENFQKSVRTRTITIGSPPPANGDYMTWASNVKESPVPVSYILNSIEDLFSERFFKDSDMKNINYRVISERINFVKAEYCLNLKAEGIVDDCTELVPGIKLTNTFLSNYFKTVNAENEAECLQKCMQTELCVAVDYCLTCERSSSAYGKCFLHREISTSRSVEERATWQTTVFLQLTIQGVQFLNAAVKGVERAATFDNTNLNITDCLRKCINDRYCVTFTFFKSSSERHPCKLYAKDNISLVNKQGAKTYFVSPRIKTIAGSSRWIEDFKFFN